jgi:hypothetical protein
MLRYLGLEYRPRLARYRPSTSGLLSFWQKCRPLAGTSATRFPMEATIPATNVRRCLLRLSPEQLEDVAGDRGHSGRFLAARDLADACFACCLCSS